MALHVRLVGKKHHPSPIRRDVREPVVPLVDSDLFLFAPIGPHAPDLHVPGALRIKVDVFSVRRIFRAVIQPFGGRQPRFFAARNRDGVDIEIVVALPHERQGLAVRRPPMPVRRGSRSDAARRSSLDRHDVNDRLIVSLRLIADGQRGLVGRNAVIVVAPFGESGVDQRRLSSGHLQPVDAAITIKEKRRSVARPVGRFQAFGCDVHYVPDGRSNGHSF